MPALTRTHTITYTITYTHTYTRTTCTPLGDFFVAPNPLHHVVQAQRCGLTIQHTQGNSLACVCVRVRVRVRVRARGCVWVRVGACACMGGSVCVLEYVRVRVCRVACNAVTALQCVHACAQTCVRIQAHTHVWRVACNAVTALQCVHARGECACACKRVHMCGGLPVTSSLRCDRFPSGRLHEPRRPPACTATGSSSSRYASRCKTPVCV